MARNLPELLRLNVGLCNIVKVIALILAMGCAVLVLERGQSSRKLLISKKCVVKMAGIIFASLGLMVTWVVHLPNVWKCLFQLLFAAVLCFVFSCYMIKRKYIWLLILFYASVCTQLVMLPLPDLSDRCHIILDFVSGIVVVQILADYLAVSELRWKWLPIAATVFLSVCNMTVLTYGFFSNVPAQDYNH